MPALLEHRKTTRSLTGPTVNSKDGIRPVAGTRCGEAGAGRW